MHSYLQDVTLSDPKFKLSDSHQGGAHLCTFAKVPQVDKIINQKK